MFKVFVFLRGGGTAHRRRALHPASRFSWRRRSSASMPSVEIVIFAAVGEQAPPIYGVICGALRKSTRAELLFSVSFPQAWLFAMGSLLIAIIARVFQEQPGGRLGLLLRHHPARKLTGKHKTASEPEHEAEEAVALKGEKL